MGVDCSYLERSMMKLAVKARKKPREAQARVARSSTHPKGSFGQMGCLMLPGITQREARSKRGKPEVKGKEGLWGAKNDVDMLT